MNFLRKPGWRWAIGGIMVVAAAVLLTIGVRGIVADEDELPEALRATNGPLPTPVPTVAPTPSNPPTPTATPAPSDAPVVHMVIERLGVDAPVMELGLDADRVPVVPTERNTPSGVSPADIIAWYNFSSKPGHGSNVVLSGHVDWLGRLGVFGRIRELQEGDIIRVFLQDGSAFTYQVTENLSIPWDDPQAVELMLPTEDELVTLITCGGTWIPDRRSPIGGNYTHRTIVRAAPVPN